MNGPREPFLDHDELAFLVGSGFVDGIAARVKRQPARLSVLELIELIRVARAGLPITRSQFAMLGGMERQEIEGNLIRWFDLSSKGESHRYNIGRALLSRGSFWTALIGASWLVLRGGLGRSLRRISTPAKPKHHGSTIRKARLEPRQDPVACKALVWKEETNAWQVDPADFDEAIFDEVQTARKVGNKLDRTQARQRILRADASEWLEGLGYENSGVRIEGHVESLIGGLLYDDLEKVLTLARRGDSLGALKHMERSLPRLNPNAGRGLYLRRLIAVLRCLKRGYPLPEPAARPAYEPSPGTLFYLIHMRDPFEINGYVSRTHLVLAAMRRCAMNPTAITRLGFPNDLSRHRTINIADEEVLEGTLMLSLKDDGNGQLGRPLDEYIDAYAERIIELARLHRPVAIHAASNYLNGLAAINAARRLGIPAVYEVRGIWEITQASADARYEKTLRYQLQRKLENEAVRAADRVVVISNPLRRFVIEHGAEPSRVSVVPNGVDTAHMRPIEPSLEVKERLRIGAEEVIIGYVGSIVRYEGIDYIIRALALLRDHGVRNFRFLLVGDGRELANLKDLATQFSVQDICIFTGRVSRSEVEALYSVIDIVPLPRRSLAVTELVPPLKPFEAMAAGKAVIVSSVEAIADMVIDGQTGMVIEKDNVEALTAALKRLIEDGDLRRKLGLRAREWVQQERSVDSLAMQLAAVYDCVGIRAAG